MEHKAKVDGDNLSKTKTEAVQQPSMVQLKLKTELDERDAQPMYIVEMIEDADNGKTISQCTRRFEDIEWLYHCLRKGCGTCGTIFPPAPDRPGDFILIDSEENLDRKLKRESKRITRYLESLTSHPTLKNCPELDMCLKENVLPEREDDRPSVFSRLSSLFSMKGNVAEVKDIDDFFELEQIYATKYEQTIRAFSENHSAVIECLKRLSGQHGHMATCLAMPVERDGERGKQMSHVNAQMMSYLKGYKYWTDAIVNSSLVSLGQTAGFYWAYTSNELEMLQRRRGLLLEYQEANAALGKTQGQKRMVAEQQRKEVEKKLEECSDNARDEIRWFRKKRATDLMSAVVDYATERAKFEHKILLSIEQSLELLKDESK